MKIAGALALLLFLNTGALAADGPLGYPYMSWGEISYPKGGSEHGLKLDTYLEQGVNWFKINQSSWIFSTFGALHLTLSSEWSEYWNNKISPIAGFGLKRTFQLLPGSYQQLFIGLRGEHTYYFDTTVTAEWRGLAFAKWGFGGDWKRR